MHNLTNSFASAKVKLIMFTVKLFGNKRERVRRKSNDYVNEQVKKLLEQEDQKLILMARG